MLEPHEVAPWFNGVERLQSDRSRRALLTLLLSGLRVQEALKLDWRDIDETKGGGLDRRQQDGRVYENHRAAAVGACLANGGAAG